jgi:hypothetical protein
VHNALERLEVRVKESETACSQRIQALRDDLASSTVQVVVQRSETEALGKELRAAVQHAERESTRCIDVLQSQLQVCFSPLLMGILATTGFGHCGHFWGLLSRRFVAYVSPLKIEAFRPIAACSVARYEYLLMVMPLHSPVVPVLMR